MIHDQASYVLSRSTFDKCHCVTWLIWNGGRVGDVLYRLVSQNHKGIMHRVVLSHFAHVTRCTYILFDYMHHPSFATHTFNADWCKTLECCWHIIPQKPPTCQVTSWRRQMSCCWAYQDAVNCWQSNTIGWIAHCLPYGGITIPIT